jgi:hypothetical protein
MMLTLSRPARLAVLLASALVLLSGTACNRFDDPADAEAVIQVTKVTTAGEKLSTAAAASADIQFDVKDRSHGKATSFLNSVTFTSFDVVYSSIYAPTTGSALGVFFSVGSTNNHLLITLIPETSRPAAGTVIICFVHFDGEDNLGRHVEFDVAVSFSFTT